jgi:hypothetical protein
VLGRKGPLRRATTRRALAPCAPLRMQASALSAYLRALQAATTLAQWRGGDHLLGR